MPELPEVETIVRTLAPRLEGRRIVEARVSSRLIVREAPSRLAARLADKTVQRLRRYGKHILFEFEQGALSVHLGMTGKLLLGGTEGPHTRAVFVLDRGVLLYDDIRQFGRLEWSDGVNPRIEALGPDALAITSEEFCRILATRKGILKPLLLNQSVLRGLGNIYTDEALFRARIHPRATVARLSRSRTLRLHQAIAEILNLAIEHRGSSISDYVDSDGLKGGFQLLHQVYGREGKPCPVCGATIRRIVVAQRGTHYCPRCQRS